MFNGKLKGYQLKGMNWLANLYEQVIFFISFLIYYYSEVIFNELK